MMTFPHFIANTQYAGTCMFSKDNGDVALVWRDPDTGLFGETGGGFTFLEPPGHLVLLLLDPLAHQARLLQLLDLAAEP